MSRPAGLEAFDRGGHAILRLRPSLMFYWQAWLACAAVIGVWFVQRQLFDGIAASLGLPAELAALGLLVGLAPILIGVAFHRFTRSYEIEDNRVLRTTVGFISRAKREYTLSDKIQIDAQQSVLARLLNFGTVGFWAGDDRSRMEWANVPNPDQIVSFIRKLSAGDVAGGVTPLATNVAAMDQSATIPDAPAAIPKPPEGTKFASHVVVLPPVPDSMRGCLHDLSGSPYPLVRNYQWVERGEPLLGMSVRTKEYPWWQEIFSGNKTEYVDTIVRSPVTGLVLYNKHDPLRATVLPVLNDPPAESGSFLFGDFKNAYWHHRQFLFQEQRMIKMGKGRFDEWQSDDRLAEVLNDLCARSCDVIAVGVGAPALPDKTSNPHSSISSTWLEEPFLRPFLEHLVDEASIQNARERQEHDKQAEREAAEFRERP